MRILASIILLLVLGGARAGDGPAYPDNCDYTGSERRAMCGDQCIGRRNSCYCGTYNDYFNPYSADEQCCLESTTPAPTPACPGTRCVWASAGVRETIRFVAPT